MTNNIQLESVEYINIHLQQSTNSSKTNKSVTAARFVIILVTD